MPPRETLNAPDELILGEQSYKTINDRVANIVLNQNKHGLPWFLCFVVGFAGLQLLGLAIMWLLYRGIGIWGPNNPEIGRAHV